MSRMPALEDLRRANYPRSARYDLQWQVDQCMGPHPLWLLEDVLHDVELRPGLRVLDLGCGLGMTSIFLAREYGLHVVAADHWISAADNQRRFDRAGLADRIEAVDAEAHALPFQPAEFDAIISIGAYHYFGTDDLYIGYISRFLRPGGILVVAVPGSVAEPRELGGLPEHVRDLCGPEALSFHTHDWWRFHWNESRHVTVTTARSQPHGCDDWLLWCRICAEHAASPEVRQGSEFCIGPLEQDAGDYLTFVMLTATLR
jgi:SAM-dependent methyltransferase